MWVSASHKNLITEAAGRGNQVETSTTCSNYYFENGILWMLQVLGADEV